MSSNNGIRAMQFLAIGVVVWIGVLMAFVVWFSE